MELTSGNQPGQALAPLFQGLLCHVSEDNRIVAHHPQPARQPGNIMVNDEFQTGRNRPVHRLRIFLCGGSIMKIARFRAAFG
jgi:hypothetical protein